MWPNVLSKYAHCWNKPDRCEFTRVYGFQDITANGEAEGAVRMVSRLWNKASDPYLHVSPMIYRATPLENGFAPIRATYESSSKDYTAHDSILQVYPETYKHS